MKVKSDTIVQNFNFINQAYFFVFFQWGKAKLVESIIFDIIGQAK
jgi:hypothetical protein